MARSRCRRALRHQAFAEHARRVRGARRAEPSQAAGRRARPWRPPAAGPCRHGSIPIRWWPARRRRSPATRAMERLCHARHRHRRRAAALPAGRPPRGAAGRIRTHPRAVSTCSGRRGEPVTPCSCRSGAVEIYTLLVDIAKRSYDIGKRLADAGEGTKADVLFWSIERDPRGSAAPESRRVRRDRPPPARRPQWACRGPT